MEMYRLRAMAMVEMRVANHTIKDIAKAFGCSPTTVMSSLDYARNEGLTKHFEQQIISRLVPEAIRVYKKRLAADDPKIAMDVIDKLVKLGDRFNQNQQFREEQDLKGYIHAKDAGRSSTAPTTAATTIAGTVIRVVDADPADNTEADEDGSVPTDPLDYGFPALREKANPTATAEVDETRAEEPEPFIDQDSALQTAWQVGQRVGETDHDDYDGA
jgi:hypothetical protein